MKKVLLFFITGCLSVLNLIAQESFLSDRINSDLFKVRQIPSSEEAVKSYFKGMNGIVYAIIYPVANCPRCESAISDFHKEIEKLTTENKTVLITAFNDSLAAKSYNKEKGYKADMFIYDTDKKYRDFLSFSIGELHIVYMLKVDIDNGRVMLGLSADDCSPEFISEFVAFEGTMEQYKFSLSENFTESLKPEHCDTLLAKEIQKIEIPEDIRISEIFYKPYYEDNSIVFNEKLRNSTLLLRLEENNTLKFCKEIKSDSIENMTYIGVPQWYYKRKKETGTLYHIALSPVISNNEIIVSYSLPNLFVTKEVDGKLLGVGYKNEPCFIFRDINGNKAQDVVSLTDTDETLYYTAHFTFGASDSICVLPCQKSTWPLSVDKEFYQDVEYMNPFDNRFYEDVNHIFRIVDRKTGKTKGYFGDLQEIHKKTMTGYYFLSPRFDSYNGNAIYTDGVSGTIHLVKNAELEKTLKTYKAFSIDTNILPEPDSTLFYTFECTEPYLEFLSREIYDIRLTDNTIHCIIKYGTHNEDEENSIFSYLEIDMDSGKTVKYVFPAHEKALNYGLWRKNGIVQPYIIFNDKVVIYNQ